MKTRYFDILNYSKYPETQQCSKKMFLCRGHLYFSKLLW